VGGDPSKTLAQGATELFDLQFSTGSLLPGVYTATLTFNNDSPEGPVTYHLTANVLPMAEPAGLGLMGLALLAVRRRRG